jgi:hypothetical protein
MNGYAVYVPVLANELPPPELSRLRACVSPLAGTPMLHALQPDAFGFDGQRCDRIVRAVLQRLDEPGA